ncbi:MAG: heme lyase CcmF/NrfE family subunit [Planctomycetota bacterium]
MDRDATFFGAVAQKLNWFVDSVSDPATFDYVGLARSLVLLALGLYGFVFLAALAGNKLRDRRLVLAARHALITAGASVIGAAGILVWCFVDGAYDLKYVHNYSEKGLALGFKIAGLWAGLDGSILFWSMLVGTLGAVMGFTFIKESQHPVGRRLEPFVYVVFAALQFFFLTVIAFVADPFTSLRESLGPENFMHMYPEGTISDGSGLNPLLVSYWMQIHPPCLYSGFVTYTVPFAYCIAGLLVGDRGGYWTRRARPWVMAAWLFNTCGVVLGGLWAYEILNWGGYWAWDPVENASFLPWLASTAFLHSIMIQEKRDMLRTWNAFLMILTFWLTIFGTYLTRSGIVSSVHAFASGAVGNWFLGLLLTIKTVGIVLIVMRALESRSPTRVQSLLSREAVFILNNMILVAIAAAVLVLTLLPKITNDFGSLFGWESISVGPRVYNLAINPFWILLLFFTAIGPSMGWVRTTPANLRRNLLGPALAAAPLACAVQFVAASLHAGEMGRLTIFEHIYPSYLVNYLACFILSSLTWEVWRTARNRAKRTNGGLTSSLVTLLVRNNRRYGGYIVHVGLALLSCGVINSSMYKVKLDDVRLAVGQSHRIGDYDIKLTAVNEDAHGGVYHSQRLALAMSLNGEQVGMLEPEKRAYPKTRYRREPAVTTEPAIHRTLAQDIYVSYAMGAEAAARPGEQTFSLTFFRNPLIFLVWTGWLVMVAGGIWASLPMGRKRVAEPAAV